MKSVCEDQSMLVWDLNSKFSFWTSSLNKVKNQSSTLTRIGEDGEKRWIPVFPKDVSAEWIQTALAGIWTWPAKFIFCENGC